MNKDSKFKFEVVKLATQVKPIVIEEKNKDFVKFGVDNMYPQYLIKLSQKTGLHTAILHNKITTGVGEGLFYEGATNKKTDDFIEKCNPYESLNDVLLKCYTDLEIFNGFYLQPIFNKAGQIAELYHMPFELIRTGKLNSKGQINKFYYYENWKPYISNLKSIEEIPAYNKTNKIKSLYYAKKYVAGNRYYPLPIYQGATTDIETLSQISIYHNSSLKNNFQPGAIFILKPGGSTSDEELQQQIDDIKEQIGAEGTGSVIVMVQDERDSEPVFTQFEVSDIDKQFSELQKSVKENIITSHNVSRNVSGLEEAGSLGGAREYAEADLVFYNNYVKKNQYFILRHFNDLLSINGLKELKIENSISNPYMYDNDFIQSVLTISEQREILGYKPLEDEQKDKIDKPKKEINDNE